MTVRPEDLTDAELDRIAAEALSRGDLGLWNLANSGKSDSPLAKHATLYDAIHVRLCDRINGRADTSSGDDSRAALAVAIDAINARKEKP